MIPSQLQVRETGSFAALKHDCSRPQTTRTLDIEERVLEAVEQDPSV